VAFERTFQFLRNTLNPSVKVRLNGEQAEVGAVLDLVVEDGLQFQDEVGAVLDLVVEDGLQFQETTDGEGVTTWTLRAPSGNILGAWDLSEGSSSGSLAAFDLDEGSSTTTYSASTVDLEAGASA